jgi:phosphatidate cytidylyltransferase
MTQSDPQAASKARDPVLLKRILSALILAPVALACVIAGGQAFSIFIAAFSAAMAWEWIRMSDATARPRAFATATGTAVGAALLAAQGTPAWVAFWILAGSVGVFMDRRPRGGATISLLGVLYVAASTALLVAMRSQPETGLVSVLYLLAVVWSADTFAYVAGTWLGGPKLLPVASPNKTWSGLVAGLIFGVAGGTLLAMSFELDAGHAALVALPIALAAVLGDLVMSLAKRRFGVKDAGSVIPGHGGVLDRVDALMLATLVAGGLMLMAPQVWPVGTL